MSAILALLADITSGAISPEDVRDAVETLRVSYGEMYVVTPGPTSVTDTTNYFDVAGTYGLGVTGYRFDMPNNGQLRYSGTETIEGLVVATMSFTVAGSNDVVHGRLAINGTSVAATEVQRKVGTGADIGAVTMAGLVQLSTNDYITAEVRNETATDDITAANLTVLAFGVAL
jgi:hypothetical protein